MAMTREQVLAQMEASYEKMPQDIRDKVLFHEKGQDWTPTLLLAEVRNDTEYGKLYVESWAREQEERQLLEGLLAALLGEPGADAMTCGDPDCPNCHGEIRPLLDTGTEPTKH